VNKGAMGEYEIYISFYTLMEISQHFMDYYLQQKAIKDGFSFREFQKVRKEYSLSKEETKTIAELVENLRKNKFLNYVDVGEITGEYFQIIMSYVQGYLDFLDALHLRTAIDVGCDYFVTKDGELRKRVQTLINKGTINEPIKITSVSGFLNILKKSRRTSLVHK
jgi:predicted nucleic acid-binding protein